MTDQTGGGMRLLALLRISSPQRLVAAALMLAALAAQAQTRVLVNPGDQGAQSRFAVYTQWKAAVEQALRRVDAKAPPASVTLSTDSTADLSATRARIPEIVVGPAHLIGSALRYGYVPVIGLRQPQQTVFVVPQKSAIRGFADMRGKRLGLPMQDSLVTYMVRGETNAANTTFKRQFTSVYETRWQDALLVCLHVHRCDVVAVERALFDQWAAAGEPVRMVFETRAVPALSVAVRADAKFTPETLAPLIAEALAASGSGERPQTTALSANDFAYVSTLGYFTPRSLDGATVVDAGAVAALLRGGARYIDTRNATEFEAGHVPGAVLVPYVEKSAKDVEFVAADDSFDLAKLGPDHSAALIFGCNGAECWKSYKASLVAVKAGYTKVHWFRGGFPEWRKASQ